MQPPLAPAAKGTGRVYALAAVTIAMISFIVVAIAHGTVASLPPWYLSAPGVLGTAICTGMSLARRERQYALLALALALAAAAVVLGWFLILSVVIAATAVVILILHGLM